MGVLVTISEALHCFRQHSCYAVSRESINLHWEPTDPPRKIFIGNPVIKYHRSIPSFCSFPLHLTDRLLKKIDGDRYNIAVKNKIIHVSTLVIYP